MEVWILPFKEPRLHLPWFDGMCPSFHTLLQNVQNLVSVNMLGYLGILTLQFKQATLMAI
jgi:hypothetical protein